jgi:hypothetical protein
MEVAVVVWLVSESFDGLEVGLKVDICQICEW